MLKDASPYNVQTRIASALHRRRILRAGLRGEPWAGHDILHALPVSVASRGASWPAVPTLAARSAPTSLCRVSFDGSLMRRDAFMARNAGTRLSSCEPREAKQRAAGGRSPCRPRRPVRRGLIEPTSTSSRATRRRASFRRTSPSGWVDYRSTCSYDADDTTQKDDFVRRTVSRRRRCVTWDLGSTTGASHSSQPPVGFTLAVDSDACVVDALYRYRDAGLTAASFRWCLTFRSVSGARVA